jgi:hypothetical protein
VVRPFDVRPLLAFLLLFAVAASLRAAPERVRVGAYVTDLYDFNPSANCYTVSMFVWTRHVSPRLHPLDTLEIKNAKSVSLGKVFEVPRNGEIWSQRQVIAVIRYDWDLRHYPFDRHVLPLNFEEGEWDTSEVVYVADAAQTKVDPASTEDGWEMRGFRLATVPVRYPTTFGDPALAAASSVFSRATLTIEVERTQIGIFLKLLLGAYVAFVLAMMTLRMDQPSLFNTRMSVLVGALFATLVNMRATEGVLGRSPDFTLVDRLHLTIAFYILAAAFVGFVTRRLAERGRKPAGERVDNVTLVAGVASFLVINAVLIVAAVRS